MPDRLVCRTLAGMDWTMVLVVAGAAGGFLALRRLGQLGQGAATEYLKQGATVVDVRTSGEFQSGHIPGAVNVPLSEIETRIPGAVPDKSQVLLLHCLSGARSALAARVLKRLGYDKSYNLGSYQRAERIVRAVRG